MQSKTIRLKIEDPNGTTLFKEITLKDGVKKVIVKDQYGNTIENRNYFLDDEANAMNIDFEELNELENIESSLKNGKLPDDNSADSMTRKYQREFDIIQKTKFEKYFKPFTKTGKRGEWLEREVHDQNATENAKKEYLMSLSPDGQNDILAALRFLMSFLPAGLDDILNKWKKSPYIDAANSRFKAILEESQRKYSFDESFMSNINSLKNNYNMIEDLIREDMKTQEAIIVKAATKRKKRKHIILFLLAAAWLLMLEDDWWWLCLILNIATLCVYGLARLLLIIDDIDDKAAKEKMECYNIEVKKFKHVV